MSTWKIVFRGENYRGCFICRAPSALDAVCEFLSAKEGEILPSQIELVSRLHGAIFP